MKRVLSMLLLWFLACKPFPPSHSPMPRLEEIDGVTRLLVSGQPFIMLAGELHNSSSSCLDYLEPIWQKLADMNLNTVIAPVSWEQFEPEEGKFDYSIVDGLIRNAHAHDLKLVLLWFGSWKNTESSYVPPWVKQDARRFFRAQTQDGRTLEIVSALCRESLQADAHAFAQLMRRIRQIDQHRSTVLMVQIENETGLLGDARDYCPAAQQAFAAEVPAELTAALESNRQSLHPELKAAWERQGLKSGGSWEEIFGEDAAEFFMAWHIARYVNAVAEAGKSEYPLPMFANAWLRAGGQRAGQYPSGGPIDKVHDIWRAAAPAIDLFAPDIYLSNFKEICADYTRNGNPLMIPEAHRNAGAVGQAMYALAQHNALGFAPFGIDNVLDPRHIRTGYGFLKNLLPLFAQHRGGEDMIGLLQENEQEERFELGGCRLLVKYLGNAERGQSCGFVIHSAPDEFLIGGSNLEVRFHDDQGIIRILQVDELVHDGDSLRPRRRLNGDETSAHQRIFLPEVVLPEHEQRLTESSTHPPLPKPPQNYSLQRVKVYRLAP